MCSYVFFHLKGGYAVSSKIREEERKIDRERERERERERVEMRKKI
jgi:hypothetical protein